MQEIMRLLQSENSEDIREGAYGAGETKDPSCISLLAGHLQSQNLGVQEAADLALRHIGGAETVRAVSPLLRSDEAPVRNLAMDILREVGGEDIQTLTELLRDNDPDIRIFISDILGSAGSTMAVEPLCNALLKDPEVNVRYQAAVSLGTLGQHQAAPCLNKALNDEEWVQFAVIESLIKIRDESSVNALTKALTKSSDLVCSMIVDALGEMGNLKAVPPLLKHMNQAHKALRNKIVKAVVMILGGKSLTLLTEQERENFRLYALAALTDEDTEIQDAAAQGLGYVGGELAAAAVLELAEKLDPQGDQERIEHLAQALAQIGLTDALRKTLTEGSWKAGMVAIKSLQYLGKTEGAKLICDHFWEKDLEMQRAMIDVLGVIGTTDQQDFFLEILDRHNDGHVLKGAMRFLGYKCKCGDPGGKLFAMLEHPYDDVKEVALDACVSVNDPQMSDKFKELFQSPEPIHRFMATYALGKLGALENIEEIRLALEDEVPDVRKVAIEALAPYCSELGDNFQLLLAKLSDEVREVRLAVVEALGNCHLPGVVESLLLALNDDDDWVRIRAVEALGERRESEAIPEIVPLLQYSNTLVALKAVEALGKIGGTVAFRALLDMVEHDDPELSEAAEVALARIKQDRVEEA